MIESLNHTIVSARIEHPHNPNLVLCDAEGRYPTMIHEQDHGTYEGTVCEIGQKVAGIVYLSVEERLKGASGNHVLYATKPPNIDAMSLSPNSEFTWRELSLE